MIRLPHWIRWPSRVAIVTAEARIWRGSSISTSHLRVLLLLLLSSHGLLVAADPVTIAPLRLQDPEVEQDDPVQTIINALDEDIELPRRLSVMHQEIGDRVLEFSDRIDDFFGDPRLETEAGKTRYRVRSEWRIEEEGESTIGVKVRGHAVLPRTRQRLGFFLESFRDDVLTDLDDLLGDPADDTDSLTAAEDVSGLRAALFSNTRGRLSLDGGVKLSKSPQARVKLRWQEDHELENLWSLRLIQSLEYRGEEGYGERTQMRFERAIEEKLLRFGIEGVWFEEQDFKALLTTSFFVPFDSRSVIRLSGHMTADLGDAPARTGVGVGVGFRRRLYSDWLFGEIAPRVFWPQKSFDGSEVSLMLVTEVIFGR